MNQITASFILFLLAMFTAKLYVNSEDRDRKVILRNIAIFDLILALLALLLYFIK